MKLDLSPTLINSTFDPFSMTNQCVQTDSIKVISSEVNLQLVQNVGSSIYSSAPVTGTVVTGLPLFIAIRV